MTLVLVAMALGLLLWLDSQLLLPPWPTSPPAPLVPVEDSDWQEFQQDYSHRFHGREPPPGMRSWLSYAKMNQCNERDFYHGMEEDLAFFRNVIQQEGRKFQWKDIEPAGLAQTDNYMGFTLHKHQLTRTLSRNFGNNELQQRQIERLLRWISEPIRNHKPPVHATYFFNLHDGATPAKATTKRPIFSACKQTYWTDNQPPPSSLTASKSQESLFAEGTMVHQAWRHFDMVQHPDFNDWATFESRDIMVPWHFSYDPNYSDNLMSGNPHAKSFRQRKDSILWRGSSTGSVWGESPRFRLIAKYGGTTGKSYQLNDQTPVMVDFAFVKILQQPNGQSLAPGTRQAKSMSYSEMQQHKYIMDVDGNAFTSRFPSLLRLGSVIFKSTRYREWYTERLQPYVDYIPVNYNLTDLPAKIEWAYQHPDVAEKIARHAMDIATRYLRKEDMRCYMYRLLLEYQTLFED